MGEALAFTFSDWFRWLQMAENVIGLQKYLQMGFSKENIMYKATCKIEILTQHEWRSLNGFQVKSSDFVTGKISDSGEICCVSQGELLGIAGNPGTFDLRF